MLGFDRAQLGSINADGRVSVAKASKTLNQKNNAHGMVKAGELIEIKQGHLLTLQDARIFDRLVEHAWPLIQSQTEFRCPIHLVRGPTHRGSERVRDSVARLMHTVLTVPFFDDLDGKRKVLQSTLIAGSVTTEDEDDPAGEILYSFSPQLLRVLNNSNYWGRIKSHISYALSSKYAYRLYQAVALRVNRDRMDQELSAEALRELLAVAPGQYEKFCHLNQTVISPAVQEVNALTDFVVEIEPLRPSGRVRGSIQGFRLAWRKKTDEEMEAVHDELLRHKTGRKARIKGTVETLAVDGTAYLSTPALSKRVLLPVSAN